MILRRLTFGSGIKIASRLPADHTDPDLRVAMGSAPSMTLVIRALPDIVMEFRMGRRVMKQMFIAVSLLLAAGVGCAEGQDRQSADGTKLFGAHTLKDGTLKIGRIELPNGDKYFDVTVLPDGTAKVRGR